MVARIAELDNNLGSARRSVWDAKRVRKGCDSEKVEALGTWGYDERETGERCCSGRSER